VNPDITYTCHITTGEATRSADKYGQNSDNPQSLSKSWTTNGCFGTAGCPLSVVAALGKPISVHSATFSVMWLVLYLSALAIFLPQWNFAVLLCGTWESIKPSYKKFASRPGLEQLIQVLETSST